MRFITLMVVIISAVCLALSTPPAEHTIQFPKNAAAGLGQISKLAVTVSCGRISSLQNIPELHNIEMEYDITTENTFKARPRLGASAVELRRWDGVISVFSEAEDCFAVKVEAEDMTGKHRQWTDSQLGLTK